MLAGKRQASSWVSGRRSPTAAVEEHQQRAGLGGSFGRQPGRQVTGVGGDAAFRGDHPGTGSLMTSFIARIAARAFPGWARTARSGRWLLQLQQQLRVRRVLASIGSATRPAGGAGAGSATARARQTTFGCTRSRTFDMSGPFSERLGQRSSYRLVGVGSDTSRWHGLHRSTSLSVAGIQPRSRKMKGSVHDGDRGGNRRVGQAGSIRTRPVGPLSGTAEAGMKSTRSPGRNSSPFYDPQLSNAPGTRSNWWRRCAPQTV